jgi:hypothetical protein
LIGRISVAGRGICCQNTGILLQASWNGYIAGSSKQFFPAPGCFALSHLGLLHPFEAQIHWAIELSRIGVSLPNPGPL